MTLSATATIASILWESVSSAYLEIICALLFFVSWHHGRNKQKARPSKIANSGSTQHQNEKAEPNRARCVSKKVIQLCNAGHVSEALTLHRNSVKTCPLSDTESCREVVLALVTATIRGSQVDKTIQIFSDLRACGLGVSNGLFASAVRVCTANKLFSECLTVFDFMSKDQSFNIADKTLWSCLLFCATEKKDFSRADTFFEQLRLCGTPTTKDFGNMLRNVSLRGDWERVLSLVQEMRDLNAEMDQYDTMLYNSILATCVAAGKVDEARSLLDARGAMDGAADVVTFNTIMKGYAKAGRIDDCFAVLQDMNSRGIASSQVTYGILLDCCICNNQLDRATEVFDEMTAMGCPMNTVLYTTLIKGFARADKLEKAMSMYQQMKADSGALPDVITFSILIKANCETDNLQGALTLLEEMISLGLKPDEVVFNTLIAGSGRQGNAKLGKALYDDMVKSGVRPSSATFSILIQLYQRCKLLDEAVTLIRDEPKKHRVEPEARLFLQLIQACIRGRQGKRATEVYGMASTTFTAAMHSGILGTCIKLNMFDTGADIVRLAAASGARFDPCDAKALLEGALKKGKTQVAQSLTASMKALGYATESELMQPIDSGAPAHLPPWRTGGDRYESTLGRAEMKRTERT